MSCTCRISARCRRQRFARLRQQSRLLVGQIASEAPDEAQLRPFELLLTSFPHFVPRFRQRGIPSEYLRIGFDPRVLARLAADRPTEDVVFVGSPRSRPAQRGNELLEHAARDAPIAFWGYNLEGWPTTPRRCAPAIAAKRGGSRCIESSAGRSRPQPSHRRRRGLRQQHATVRGDRSRCAAAYRREAEPARAVRARRRGRDLRRRGRISRASFATTSHTRTTGVRSQPPDRRERSLSTPMRTGWPSLCRSWATTRADPVGSRRYPRRTMTQRVLHALRHRITCLADSFSTGRWSDIAQSSGCAFSAWTRPHQDSRQLGLPKMKVISLDELESHDRELAGGQADTHAGRVLLDGDARGLPLRARARAGPRGNHLPRRRPDVLLATRSPSSKSSAATLC